MSSKAASPTAQLLRNSRLFSLPPPLQNPHQNSSLSGLNRVSPTASTPYPIQQAVASPSSSVARGDWGLKRPLPLRSTTKSSTAVFRINTLDTREHVTDFTPAADLTLTLEKFGELKMPVLIQGERTLNRSSGEAAYGAFEDVSDNTDAGAKGEEKARWKHQGPYLAGLSEAEFLKYLQREVKGRKAGFLSFLRQERVRQIGAEEARKARDEGSEVSGEVVGVSDEEFSSWIVKLRSEFTTGNRASGASRSAELVRLMAKFLDLPAHGITDNLAGEFAKRRDSAMGHVADGMIASIMSGAQGPPSTHPSAGLSYLRADANMANHPILGPQQQKIPIPARVLENDDGSLRATGGRLGVAGFVASSLKESTQFNTSAERISRAARQRIRHADEESPEAVSLSMRSEMDGSTPGMMNRGGTKIWVNVDRVYIDEEGRTRVSVSNTSRAAVGVHTGEIVQDTVTPDDFKKFDFREGISGRGRNNMKKLQMGPLAYNTAQKPGNYDSYGLGNSEGGPQGGLPSRESPDGREMIANLQDAQNRSARRRGK